MNGQNDRAVLAGGCFWGMQDLLRRYPGIVSTRVGYTGGDVPNATYRNHGTHAEAIEIIFNSEKISYRKILEFFFQIHDPTTLNRQGNDWGASYRSAIFYTSDEQRRVAEDTIADVEASGLWPGRDNDGGVASRPVLGGRAGAPGLFGTHPGGLHLPLYPAQLDTTPPPRHAIGGNRRTCQSCKLTDGHLWVTGVGGLIACDKISERQDVRLSGRSARCNLRSIRGWGTAPGISVAL